MNDRYDIVLYGATGFTGRRAARYLAAHAPAGLRLALAGRRREALVALQRETGAAGVLVADSADAAAVDAMAAQARVLVTTAGPFARHGTEVFAACVRHRVDYADLTGETFWVRQMIDRHHATAAAQGTRMIPCCGVDSVPSDLGALLVATEIRQRFDQPTRRIDASFAMRGGLNGGTLESALGMQDPAARAAMDDVLLLNPPDQASAGERARSADFTGVRHDPVRRTWLGPFMMAPINTRVVRRSHGLLAGYGQPWGEPFTYAEALELRTRAQAQAVAWGARAAGALLSTRAGAWLARRVGPRPGEGPSERTIEHGFLRVRLLGEAQDGRRLLVSLAADGDPGNRVTVTCLGEAALLLATARDSLPGAPDRGGVLTPATGLGLPLLERLKDVGWRVQVAPVD